MDRKTVLLDMDDTINYCSEKIWSVYNEKYNDNVNLEDVDIWDISRFATKMKDPSILFSEPGFFRDLKPMPYAIEFVKKLMKNYNVYLVTDSPEGTGTDAAKHRGFSNPLDDKREWVKEYLPFFPISNIIACSQKWLVKGDVLVDDKPSTFKKYRELGRLCILMDAPYNRYIDTKWRVHNLKEAEEMINKILRDKSYLKLT